MATPLLTPSIISAITSTPTKYNLLPFSEDLAQWAPAGCTITGPLGLNALGMFSGYRIESGGSQWHRLTALELPVVGGEIFSVRLYLREGSSSAVRVTARYVDSVINSDNIVGSFSALPGSSGSIEVVENSLEGDGLTRSLVLRITAPRTTLFQLGVGPNSNTVGEDVIALAAQVEKGATASAYQKTP